MKKILNKKSQAKITLPDPSSLPLGTEIEISGNKISAFIELPSSAILPSFTIGASNNGAGGSGIYATKGAGGQIIGSSSHTLSWKNPEECFYEKIKFPNILETLYTFFQIDGRNSYTNFKHPLFTEILSYKDKCMKDLVTSVNYYPSDIMINIYIELRDFVLQHDIKTLDEIDDSFLTLIKLTVLK